MRAEDVPAEWMAACDAVLVPGKWLTTNDLRRALAAVAPLIAAQEREAIAQMVEAFETIDSYGIDGWERRPNPTGRRIAAAIRARGEAGDA